jgi:hypothetical protein
VSSTDRGNGGEINIWSSRQTTVAGSLIATGGRFGGNGGSVETSSTGKLSILQTAIVNVAARAGRAGSWMLDPESLVVDASLASAISSALGGANVTVAVSGSLTIAEGVSIASPSSSGTTLTLLATDTITHNGSVSTAALNMSSASVNLAAGSTTTSNQTYISAQNVDVNGTVSSGAAGTFANGTVTTVVSLSGVGGAATGSASGSGAGTGTGTGSGTTTGSGTSGGSGTNTGTSSGTGTGSGTNTGTGTKTGTGTRTGTGSGSGSTGGSNGTTGGTAAAGSSNTSTAKKATPPAIPNISLVPAALIPVAAPNAVDTTDQNGAAGIADSGEVFTI